jgi:hypothetical protein
VASTISNLAATVQAYALSSFAAPTGNIAMGGYTLTGLATPTAAGQAAEYSWVVGQIQSAAAGISSKDPVQVVSIANIASLSGLPTVDGQTLTAGQRILLTAQTTASQNGVYNVASGSWTRVTTEASNEMDPGATWLVLTGTSYGGTLWRMSTTGTITVGTTSVSIVQFSAGLSYSAGASGGLTLTSGAFSIQLQATSWMVLGSTGVAVDTSRVSGKLAATITGDGASTSYTVTHALPGGLDVMVQVYDPSTGATVDTDVTRSSTTTVAIGFAVAPASGKAYRVVLMG